MCIRHQVDERNPLGVEMSLVDDIAAYQPKGCVTCNWYRGLPEKERGAFDKWVEDFRQAPRSYPLADLQDLCEPYGLATNPRSFREHVQGHHAKAGASSGRSEA